MTIYGAAIGAQVRAAAAEAAKAAGLPAAERLPDGSVRLTREIAGGTWTDWRRPAKCRVPVLGDAE